MEPVVEGGVGGCVPSPEIAQHHMPVENMEILDAVVQLGDGRVCTFISETVLQFRMLKRSCWLNAASNFSNHRLSSAPPGCSSWACWTALLGDEIEHYTGMHGHCP